ncbi:MULTISPECIES: hypothetical protein [Pseudoalteromonas]|jgi:hypothetical protein|tara:strand:- start:6524 stop:6784 length:261 start_codon:yes stop_codon:yes gene_type:complete
MMFIDYFIKKPQKKVNNLSQQMDLLDELKRQHHQAFNYRLKRFAVTKVGLASAFSAGVGYGALKNDDHQHGKLKQLSQFSWLLRLL